MTWITDLNAFHCYVTNDSLHIFQGFNCNSIKAEIFENKWIHSGKIRKDNRDFSRFRIGMHQIRFFSRVGSAFLLETELDPKNRKIEPVWNLNRGNRNR